jgi:hypothetical protein
MVLAALAVPSQAAPGCSRQLTADVVAIDQPLMFNRLGAQNINGMVYALKGDLVNVDTNLPLHMGGAAEPGKVRLRADKRPRPLVLRIAQGDCLTVQLTNLLTPSANPFKDGADDEPHAEVEIEVEGEGGEGVAVAAAPRPANLMIVDEQVRSRHVSFTVPGMHLVNSISDDGSYVGRNPNAIAPQGGSRTYTLYGERDHSGRDPEQQQCERRPRERCGHDRFHRPRVRHRHIRIELRHDRANRRQDSRE